METNRRSFLTLAMAGAVLPFFKLHGETAELLSEEEPKESPPIRLPYPTTELTYQVLVNAVQKMEELGHPLKLTRIPVYMGGQTFMRFIHHNRNLVMDNETVLPFVIKLVVPDRYYSQQPLSLKPIPLFTPEWNTAPLESAVMEVAEGVGTVIVFRRCIVNFLSPVCSSA